MLSFFRSDKNGGIRFLFVKFTFYSLAMNFKVSREMKIGIIMVVAIALFIWGVSFLKGINLFNKKHTLYALYPKIDGLIPASPLMINGYKIGQVNDLKLIQKKGNYYVLVRFIVTEDLNIPKGSIAKAYSSDLLGTKAVEIIPGESLEMVKDGDTLTAMTEEGLKESVDKRIAPLQAKAENLISSIDSVMTVVNAVLNKKTRENLTQSFESIRKAILSLEQTAYHLDDLVKSEKAKISQLITNLNRITGNLAENEKKINQIISNLGSVSDSLSKSQLKQAINNAEKSLGELNLLLAGINSGKGTLGKLAKNDSLYMNLNKSMENLKLLLGDLKEHPKRYIHFSLFGKKDKKLKN
ncbi:MAG: MlaD family protein [Bacteroidia bacterium]|nr:MlaD family protein [Bacteroidia bacterium]